MKNFLNKAFAWLIQYTIGLLFPWWLIDIINRSILESYDSKFLSYKKINRYTVGLIFPWWALFLVEGNKMSISTSDSRYFEKNHNQQKNKKVYCRYCGSSHSSVYGLTSGACRNNPSGGRHVVYDGELKPRYTCKFCGMTHTSIYNLTSGACHNNPSSGKHEPAL